MPFELSLVDLVSPYVLQGDTFGAWHAVLAVLRVSEHEIAGDENGITIRGTVDFGPIGAPGLTATSIYASGKDRVANGTGAPLPDHWELDVRADYAFAKGTWAEGLVATFRYSWLHQDGSLQNQTDLRAILNYGVRF